MTAVFDKQENTGDINTLCSSCGETLSPLTLPGVCNLGHRGRLGWWDTAALDWAAAHSSGALHSGDKVWISGYFEGVYVGKPAGALVSSTKDEERYYHIDRFEDASLTDLTIEQEPPPARGQDNQPPIRIKRPQTVTIKIKEAQEENSERYGATLDQFCLFDWHETNGGELSLFHGKQSIGILSGRAYGTVRLDQLREKKDPLKVSPHDDPIAGDPKTITPPAAPPIDGSREANDTANGKVAATTATDLEPHKPCFACALIPRLILAALVWYFCNWKHALLFFGVTTLTCILSDKWVAGQGWKRNLLLAGLLLLALIGASIEAYALAFSDDCSLISDWPVYLIGSAFVLSAFIPFCWVRVVMLAIWFLSTIVWCGANSIICDEDKNQKRIDVLIHDIDVVVDYIVNPETDTDEVNDNTIDPNDPENDRKISIDEVIKNPDLVDKCGNSIYLSEVALFELNQFEIQPRAEVQLRKLSVLLDKKKERNVIITGHADKSGDNSDKGYLENIELSNNRAKAVADWLVKNGSLDVGRLEIRAAGTSMPITTDPQNAHLNRRVEVQLECPREMQMRNR